MKVTVQQGPFASPLHGGEYAATGPGGVFPAWCVEQSQYLRLGDTIDYQLVDGIEAWGVHISQALDRLMSWTIGAGWPTTLEQNDAVQSDIWAILAGQPGKIDATSASITQHAMLLHNDSRQDLLSVSAIPEPDPATLLVLGAVAIALGLKASRRSV